LQEAHEALVIRRRRREEQGVLGKREKHRSEDVLKTG
jgi:hypothetical protein